MIRTILRFLFRLGLLRRPKKHRYAVEVQLYLDGEQVLRFPSEVDAFSRIHGRYLAKKRLTFTTATTASFHSYIENSNLKLFSTELQVRADRKIIKTFPVLVKAAKRREAKFDIGRRLVVSIGAAARKDHLLKHA